MVAGLLGACLVCSTPVGVIEGFTIIGSLDLSDLTRAQRLSAS